jgi:hypothetical protein
MMLSKVFVPKRGDVIGDLRELQNEGFRDLYSSPNTKKGSDQEE